ncbi:MAG TPA: hypothetical protein DD706_14605 [Nitrospiraceae bacterium]|nr:hypothetical protein [Nitrospiraceae bacterium]
MGKFFRFDQSIVRREDCDIYEYRIIVVAMTALPYSPFQAQAHFGALNATSKHFLTSSGHYSPLGKHWEGR